LASKSWSAGHGKESEGKAPIATGYLLRPWRRSLLDGRRFWLRGSPRATQAIYLEVGMIRPKGTSPHHQICSRCIMDTSVPGITFDANGVCDLCREYEARARRVLPPAADRSRALSEAMSHVRALGVGRPYDAIAGLSGGVDSSYAAYIASRHAVRLLGVHLDNGWNTEQSNRNVANLVSSLGIKLVTESVSKEEFSDLQIAFMRSSVPDIEILTDHAIHSVLLREAARSNVRVVISGGNLRTEGISPKAWGYNMRDLKYIKAIHRQFGHVKMSTYPGTSILKFGYYKYVRGTHFVRVLDYVDYRLDEAKRILKEKTGWQDYGGKHYESVFTRFFQAYILPEKFGVDKRRAHFSTLLMSGQMTRDEALAAMESPPYPTEEMAQADREIVLSRLGLPEHEFQAIMALPVKSWRDYPSSAWLFRVKYFLDRMGIRISSE